MQRKLPVYLVGLLCLLPAPSPAADLPQREGRAIIYGTPEYAAAMTRGERTITLRPGPHLFLDEYLIESSQNLTRQVQAPARDSKGTSPIITGKEDRCFQPYFTVSVSPETGKFRIWYGASRDDRSMGRYHLA